MNEEHGLCGNTEAEIGGAGPRRTEPVILPVILVIDDSEDDFVLLERALHSASVPACLIRTSSEAEISNYLNGTAPYQDRQRFPLPSLILLDWKLPGKEGSEVLVWLREQPQSQALPIIVFSSAMTNHVQDKACQAGASACIEKPTSFAQLKAFAANLKSEWLGS